MSSEKFKQELHAELLDAAARLSARRRPHRRFPAMVAAAAAVVAVLVGGFAVLGPRQASAGVEVIRQGDELIIKLTDVETRPDEIEKAAREAGVDVTVEEVPVGPSNVGRFVGESAGAYTEQLYIVDGDRTSGSNGVVVPVDFPSDVQLRLGRAARPGEAWAISSVATAKGEILECDDLSGRPLSEVLEKIRRRGIKDVRVFIADAGGELPVSELAQHQSATVVRVESNEKNGLMVLAADDLNSLPPQPTVPASSRCG